MRIIYVFSDSHGCLRPDGTHFTAKAHQAISGIIRQVIERERRS